MRLRIIPVILAFAFIVTGCSTNTSSGKAASAESSKTKSQVALKYEENDKPLEYDEIMLWASDMASQMSSVQAKSDTKNKDGTVSRDYDYATIKWSGETAPKILELVMTKANLACPRGVFLGNPLKKVLAYYKTPKEPDISKKQTFYYNENKSEGKYNISYGFSEDSKIIFGAAKKDITGKYNDARICFAFREDKVESITYSFAEHSDPSEIENYINSKIDK